MPRGGSRMGAGRKPKPESEKTRLRAFTLPLGVIEYLQSKQNASQYVANLILEDMRKVHHPGGF